jgi:5-hydroxyisourate hydrolase-like protein (transthyretin family)
MRLLKLTVAAFLMFAGQDVMAETKIGPELLYGKVYADEEGKPLRDVTVTVINVNKKVKSTISEIDGYYKFDELKPGTYKFIFEKDGYRKVVKEKVIRENTSSEMNVEMEKYSGFDLAPSPLHFIGEEK